MCPPHRELRRVLPPRDTTFHTWVNTAVCAIEVVYPLSSGFACFDCVLTSPDCESYLDKLYNHHYLHIGDDDCFPTCKICGEVTTLIRPAQDCEHCDQKLADLLVDIERTNDNLHTAPEHTILTIRQD